MDRNFVDMSGSNAGMGIVQSGLTALVPENEQAVDGEVVCAEKEIRLNVVNPYASILSAEDLAVEPMENLSELAEADKKGFFSPVIGMARLTNTLGGRYFAQICIDEKGYRRIEICQEYETGGFSPKIIIKQSDFLRAATYNFGEAAIPHKKLKNAVENFMLKLSSECLDKFDETMTFDVMQIMSALKKCYRNLPVHNDFCEIQSPSEFYRSIMDVIRETGWMDNDVMLYGHKAYYPFKGEDIQFIAEKLDMKKKEFLEKLVEHNFLYLTESSKGYQTNVRLTSEEEDGPETYTKWRYCLLRLEYLASK